MGAGVRVAGGDAPASLLQRGVQADGMGGVEQKSRGVMAHRHTQIANAARVGELDRKTGVAAHQDVLPTGSRET